MGRILDTVKKSVREDADELGYYNPSMAIDAAEKLEDAINDCDPDRIAITYKDLISLLGGLPAEEYRVVMNKIADAVGEGLKSCIV